MTINQILIRGYRGFQIPGQIDFSVPNGTNGSGLTVITGPNNAGKSTILECLKVRTARNGVSFTSGVRNQSTDYVELHFSVNGKKEIIASTKKGSSETVATDVDRNEKIFVLPSRRAFNPYFGKSRYSREQYSGLDIQPQRSSQLSGFEYRLFTTLENPQAFNLLLQEVLGYLPEWSIDQTDQGQFFLKFYNGEHAHSSDGMGEGVVSIFSIVDSLHDSEPGHVVVIDEPELSLHPSLQKRLASMIFRFSADRQIILSTHSPYFVNLEALSNGGSLARVVTGPKGTEIHQLGTAGKASLSKLCNSNLYNPHVFGLDAKELFFLEDRIILTEGQEDVLLYPKIASQLGMNLPGSFFGWGVGGAGNVSHLCQILKELGFQKVAALLDGDKATTADVLSKSFNSYSFFCIPAVDIRTKPATKPRDAVDGLVDEKLAVKAEFKGALVDIFAKLQKSFV